MKFKLDEEIEALDISTLAEAVKTGDKMPRGYQWLTYNKTGEVIKRYAGPVYVTASVGAGKTIMIAMIASRFTEIGMKGMIIARQGEIVDQDAEECWDMSVNNSIFSASVGRKQTTYPVIVGSEGTVFNALYDKGEKKQPLSDYVPDYLLIDECHQVDWEDVVSDKPTTQYGVIITEFQRRCQEKNGRKLRIIGYTGSPFRSTTSIKGPFWTEEIVNISTKYLVEKNYLVPTIFGSSETDSEEFRYDLSRWHSSDEDGVADFTDSQLKEMEADILNQTTTTQKIIMKVVELTQDRNGVLITCSGKKHCEEAAKFLPEGSFVIVTEDMGQKARKKALKDAYTGRKKYILQIGCLTTGVNVPFWDTSVILRKIMSLTLLVQLLGRGMRLPAKWMADAGIIKTNHLVLDFTGTMYELGEMYDDPILEDAQLQKSERNKETIPCPKCQTENSTFARRCIGEDENSPDGRCEYFFRSRVCGENKDGSIKRLKDGTTGCGAENDPAARFCRCCGFMLIDPNDKLHNRAYSDDDWITIDSFRVVPTKNKEGIIYEYSWFDELNNKRQTARELFWPSSRDIVSRNIMKMKGVIPHVSDKSFINKIMKSYTTESFLQWAPLILAPIRITHRKNDEGRDIIHRKDFKGPEGA